MQNLDSVVTLLQLVTAHKIVLKNQIKIIQNIPAFGIILKPTVKMNPALVFLIISLQWITGI